MKLINFLKVWECVFIFIIEIFCDNSGCFLGFVGFWLIFFIIVGRISFLVLFFINIVLLVKNSFV